MNTNSLSARNQRQQEIDFRTDLINRHSNPVPIMDPYDKYNDIEEYSKSNPRCYAFERHSGQFLLGHIRDKDKRIMRFNNLETAKMECAKWGDECTGITQEFIRGKNVYTLRSGTQIKSNNEHNPLWDTWVKRFITEDEHYDMESNIIQLDNEELDEHSQIVFHTDCMHKITKKIHLDNGNIIFVK